MTIFTPLDIPPIPNKQSILDNFDGKEKFVCWDEETLMGKKDFSKPFGEMKSWNDMAKQKYPELLQWIDKHLPFEYKFYVRLARSTGNVKPHVDGNYVESPYPGHHMTITQDMLDHQLANEPIGYRFVVSGSRDTLYMCKEYDYTKDMSTQQKWFCTIPQETDAFLINNCTQPHGVDVKDVVDDDRIVGFVLGKVIESEHRNLIKRSIAKYKQYVLQKENLV
tara:strand:+ start:4615 stop:5280 length:666 start_codon:yes stop_codon:yes gene_type:complete